MLRIPAVEEDRQEESELKGGWAHFFLSHLLEVYIFFFFFPVQYCGFQSSVISNNVASVHFILEFAGFSTR